MKKYIQLSFWSICLFALPQRSAAQLVNLFTQYQDHPTYFNPAALPSDFLLYQRKTAVGLSARSQWLSNDLKDEGSPRTFLARFDQVLEANNVMTYGGFLVNDRFGPSEITGVYGRYAYQIRPSTKEDIFIGVGMTAGLLQYKVDNSGLDLEGNDQLESTKVQRWIPDFGVGVNFVAFPQRGMKFYAGASLPQIASISARFLSKGNQEVIFERPVHFMGTLGLVLPVGDQGFIEPTMWLKHTKNQPTNVHLNLRQKFVNNFWLGVGYATSKTMHIEAGMIVGESWGLDAGLLRIGYGFDYNVGGYGSFLGTSHELNVNFAFGTN